MALSSSAEISLIVKRLRLSDLFRTLCWFNVTDVQPFGLKENMRGLLGEILEACPESDEVTDGLEMAVDQRIEALSDTKRGLTAKLAYPSAPAPNSYPGDPVRE
jgi:hypothetical protein